MVPPPPEAWEGLAEPRGLPSGNTGSRWTQAGGWRPGSCRRAGCREAPSGPSPSLEGQGAPTVVPTAARAPSGGWSPPPRGAQGTAPRPRRGDPGPGPQPSPALPAPSRRGGQRGCALHPGTRRAGGRGPRGEDRAAAEGPGRAGGEAGPGPAGPGWVWRRRRAGWRGAGGWVCARVSAGRAEGPAPRGGGRRIKGHLGGRGSGQQPEPGARAPLRAAPRRVPRASRRAHRSSRVMSIRTRR